jgi:hypothetical protein
VARLAGVAGHGQGLSLGSSRFVALILVGNE